jgi:S1-C subfamily serine protease
MSGVDKVWFDIQERLRTSVVQIFASHGSFNIAEPYYPPTVREARGSGFIITSEGHIITNAHVVSELLSLSFKAEQAGDTDLRAELIAICPAKDVALLKCHPDDLHKLGDFAPLTFGDDQKLSQMQNVLVVGFPLGRERIKFTAGVMSGYEAPDGDVHDTSQSYIQIDAALNPGNSGGPLITLDGKVVGINSAGIPSLLAQNTNFAIPARVILSILRELFARERDTTLRKVVVPPSLGLTLQRVTNAHYAWVGVEREEDKVGMMVKNVIKGSSFASANEGDILRAVMYADPYRYEESFEVSSYRNGGCSRCLASIDTEILITSTGSVKVSSLVTERGLSGNESGGEEGNGESSYTTTTNDESSYTKNRKVSLQEVMDTIPVDTMLTLEILRASRLEKKVGKKEDKSVEKKVGKKEGRHEDESVEKGVWTLEGPFRNQDALAIKTLYPPFDHLDYVIFGGAVWIPLSANVIKALGDTKYICEYVPHEKRYEPRVIITRIFPLTEIHSIGSINPTETLMSLDGVEIDTLESLKTTALLTFKSNKPYIIKFKSGKVVVLDKKVLVAQDVEVHKKFQIAPNEFSRRLLGL